jgi:ubiquinone/menaquinone biosynthesis C-methylase UbiE
MATSDTLVAQARGSLSRDDCQNLYAQWAATYDHDVLGSQKYVAPSIIAQIALGFSTHVKGAILDAGCGTGLVGVGLMRGGSTTIDGFDLSPAMLKVAEQSGAYRNLIIGDLTQQIPQPDDTYDMVTCVGTFTHGHVGPDPALREFARVTTKNGLIIATILDEVWVSGGYKAEVEKLEREGLVEVVSVEFKDYRKGRDQASVIVLRKRGAA